MVAHRPWACSRNVSNSAFSRLPLDTTALPWLCTCSISVVALWWLYPNSFWNTKVTYDMRLIGSFQTLTIHGTSGRTVSSPRGRSTSTGAVATLAIAPLWQAGAVSSGRTFDGRETPRWTTRPRWVDNSLLIRYIED